MKILETFTAGLLTLSLSAEATPIMFPAPAGMVGWWTGETGGEDSVGSNHGTLAGGTAIVPGKVGNAFGFSSPGSVTIPHNPALSFTSALTIELWYRTDVNNTAYYGLVGKRTATLSTANYGINFVPGVGIGPYYNDPLISGTGDEHNAFETSRYLPAPAAGAFHHLAATYAQVDSTHIRMETFIDGQIVRTLTLPGVMSRTVNTAPFVIGTTYGSPGESFIGVIDEVSLYNRALTSEEIQGIYGADMAGKVVPEPSALALVLCGMIGVILVRVKG